MTLLVDNREGSWQLARHEPIRSLLSPCPACRGIVPGCLLCEKVDRKTGERITLGRQLSRITTSRGEGGPDVLMVGNGPTGPLLIAVEVKDIRDLIQSADSGRLQAEGEGQLPAMLADYHQNWLLWYGAIRCGDDGYLEEPGGNGANGRCLWKPFTKNGARDGEQRHRPLPCEYLDAMLLAIAAMGVHVWPVGNIRQAARWLGSLYAYWSKPYAEHTFTRTFSAAPRFPKVIVDPATGKPLPQTVLARARRVFDRYSGLGMERALAAAKHFPSVQAMANATEREWREVSGIGPVIAAAMVKEFRE